MQLVALNVPVLLLVNDTVPVGVTAPVPDASETVAVHVDAVLSRTLAGEHTIAVELALIVDARVNVPLLPLCEMSPRYVPVINACPTTVGV